MIIYYLMISESQEFGSSLAHSSGLKFPIRLESDVSHVFTEAVITTSKIAQFTWQKDCASPCRGLSSLQELLKWSHGCQLAYPKASNPEEQDRNHSGLCDPALWVIYHYI